MKFLSSVLLTSSAIFGGRIDSSAPEVSLPAGCKANCTFSENWACPSGQKKGAKGFAGIKNNDYRVCCDGGNWQSTCNTARPAAFQVEGAAQCLKCDEKKKTLRHSWTYGKMLQIQVEQIIGYLQNQG